VTTTPLPLAANPVPDEFASAWERPARRQVFRGYEYGEVTVPIELLLRHGRLSLYEESLGHNLFQIQMKGGKFVVKAGGCIGLIPLNDLVVIEVEPRIPIGNLERILLFSESYSQQILFHFNRDYGKAEGNIPSMLDALAYRFLDLIERIQYEGLHYQYVQVSRCGRDASGRISPYASVCAQLKAGDPFQLVSATYRRTLDNAPNRSLRMAIRKLRRIYADSQRKGWQKLLSRLAQAEAAFVRTGIDESLSFLNDAELRNYSLLPSQRESYPAALAISEVLLSDSGVNIRSADGLVSAHSVLVNMEKVFEGYIRDVLSKGLPSQEITVLDGNRGGHKGAARRLFTTPHHFVAQSDATPDIVLCNFDRTNVRFVIDAKYKPCSEQPDRDDLNQVITYGAAYGTTSVALAYPHRFKNQSHIIYLGKVGTINVYKLQIDLNSPDLPEEESAFCAALIELSRQLD